MATRHSTGSCPAFAPSTPIRPAVIRGQLYFRVAEVFFTSFRQAATAWSAAESHRLGLADEIDALIVERTSALAELRRAGADMARFTNACKREAELALQIRQLRRQGGVA